MSCAAKALAEEGEGGRDCGDGMEMGDVLKALVGFLLVGLRRIRLKEPPPADNDTDSPAEEAGLRRCSWGVWRSVTPSPPP